MIVPLGSEPTLEERYQWKLKESLKKAKHLSERIEMFINDIDKGKFKDTDRKKIKTLLKEQLTKTYQNL